jgi:hypothetical protein
VGALGIETEVAFLVRARAFDVWVLVSTWDDVGGLLFDASERVVRGRRSLAAQADRTLGERLQTHADTHAIRCHVALYHGLLSTCSLTVCL